jgi:amino-acid N-acetyltransferase
MTVILRPAQPEDVPHILRMVNRFAEQNIMLPRSEGEIRHALENWVVAAHTDEPPPGEPQLVACGALVALTDTLVEVRSLAVDESQQGKGLGSVIVERLLELAREQGYAQVCALTLRENFFLRLGFELVDRWAVSPKVWQACIYCPKFHRCDEVAVLMTLRPAAPRGRGTTSGAVDGQGGWSSLLKWSEWQPLKLAWRQPPNETTDGAQRSGPMQEESKE